MEGFKPVTKGRRAMNEFRHAVMILLAFVTPASFSTAGSESPKRQLFRQLRNLDRQLRCSRLISPAVRSPIFQPRYPSLGT
jgi:hypothetical protein